MRANGATVRFRADGPAPEIEITIGQGQWGEYDIFLWDKNHNNPVRVGSGSNDDDEPDLWQISDNAAALAGRRLSWQVGIAAPQAGPGQNWSLIVEFFQGDDSVAKFVDQGVLNSDIFFRDYVDFEVT